jgi:oligopeptide/dipeptide ABC transporter ATP-binding protein
MPDDSVLVRAEGIHKRYPAGGRPSLLGPRRMVHAVDGVDLSIREGRTLALVGESGSGKTTLGQIIAALNEPTEGSVWFDGQPLTTASPAERLRLRAHLQFIFQDPFSSLNPRQSIRSILARPFEIHRSLTRDQLESELRQLLELVGLTPPGPNLDRHPHQFSGGQRQRIVFARAIALRPRFIVADEPVSSLDMSVKAQLLTLLRQFQRELDLTYLVITHELAVVRTIAQEVAVMYLGRIVEQAATYDALERPLHPYTAALVSATPILDPEMSRARHREPLRGTMPSPIDRPPGCHFNTRCPYARDRCFTDDPPLRVVGERMVACHRVGEPDFPFSANLGQTVAAAASSTAPAASAVPEAPTSRPGPDGPTMDSPPGGRSVSA